MSWRGAKATKQGYLVNLSIAESQNSGEIATHLRVLTMTF